MRLIDLLAIVCAILSLVSFVWSSGSLQAGRSGVGTVQLLMGMVALLLGIASGVASVGTDGYQPLSVTPALVATASVTARAGDSLTARVTWPDGLTRTFRLGGVRTRFDVRVLHWKVGGVLVGAAASWEFSGVTAEYGDGQTAVGSARNVQRSRPVSVYDLVQYYPALSAIVETEEWSVELPVGTADAELRVSASGLAVGN